MTEREDKDHDDDVAAGWLLAVLIVFVVLMAIAFSVNKELDEKRELENEKVFTIDYE